MCVFVFVCLRACVCVTEAELNRRASVEMPQRHHNVFRTREFCTYCVLFVIPSGGPWLGRRLLDSDDGRRRRPPVPRAAARCTPGTANAALAPHLDNLIISKVIVIVPRSAECSYRVAARLSAGKVEDRADGERRGRLWRASVYRERPRRII